MSPTFVLSNNGEVQMHFKTIVLATVFGATSSLAFSQPAPIGSSADFGNGAVINRGPVRTVGEDMDFRTSRSTRLASPRRAHFAKHRHRHIAEDKR
jgi:hypothetical protein